MDFRMVEITSASRVKIKSSGITTVIIPTNEEFDMGEDEIGILQGRFSHHWKGAYFQGGILNPGWKGKITCEMLIVGGEITFEKDEQVAMAIIFKGNNLGKYLFQYPEGNPSYEEASSWRDKKE